MKRILILIIGLIGVAYGQSSPTSAKTRFVNGLYVGTKLDAYFNAADSNAIYWRADSVVMAKYKGTARALAFASALGSYKLVADTFFTTGYTTRARTKQLGDSLGSVKSSSSQSGITVVDMYYDLLKGTGPTSTETFGWNIYDVGTASSRGDTILRLSSNASIAGSYALVAGQMIVYAGQSGQYYTTKIKAISGANIIISNPLLDSVTTGQKVSNFYNNEAHPNALGYYALADYAMRSKTQYKVESRFNLNTALGSGVVSPSLNNSIGNTGSSQVSAYSVTSPTALTDGITATFNVFETGAHSIRLVVNTINGFVRARISYAGFNYDTTFRNTQPSTISIPFWASEANTTATISLAHASNGGTFIVNENVQVLKTTGFTPFLNAQKHVLLGDSWFAQYYLDLRIRDVLTNATIIEEGNGGFTSEQLVRVFKDSVAPRNPNVVWLIAGTNDYYQGVTWQRYSRNINRIKWMCDSIGAHLILFTPSVGATELDTTRFKLSRQYANYAKFYDERTSINDSFYLKILDTASMLLPYLLNTDTASMLSPYVPYSGATTDVNLGTNKLLTSQVNLSGTGNEARIAYNGSLGLILQGKAGTVSNFELLTPLGGTILSNPIGTNNISITGRLSVISDEKTTSGFYYAVVDTIIGGVPQQIKYRNVANVLTDLGGTTLAATQTQASALIRDSLNALVRLRASTGGGVSIQNNSGTNVATFGVGGGLATSYFGRINLEGTSYIRSSSTLGFTVNDNSDVFNHFMITNSTGNARFNRGTLTVGNVEGTGTGAFFAGSVTAARGRLTSLVLNKDSVPITSTNIWALMVDTASGRIQRNTVTSGVYLPTAANVSNTSAITADTAQFMRVGNVVTVSGRIVFSNTLTDFSQISLSLPFATVVSSVRNVAGTANENIAEKIGIIRGRTGTNDALLEINGLNTSTYTVYYTYTYRIL